MRLVAQTTLYFAEGKSDKVYQVDLCETGPTRFVVNFRYGRRGATLREGTKTEAPVSESKARGLFDALVAGKVAKGYRATPPDQGEGTAPPAPTMPVAAAKAPSVAVMPAVEQALLASLAQGERAERPLNRIIWRVGELGLRAAEPYLLELVDLPSTQSDSIRSYSLIVALGRCGGSASIAPLQKLRQHKQLPPHHRVMAGEALRAIGDAPLRASLRGELLALLSDSLRPAAEAGDSDKLEELLRETLERGKDTQLLLLYRLGEPGLQPAILAALERIPLARDHFHIVRSIFKLAEFRRDAAVFGLLAHRFETTRPGPSGWYDNDSVFKIRTRRYLRRRVARTLRKLGDAGSPDFVPMAVGVLLPFTDDDAKAPRQKTYESWNYSTRESRQSQLRWDAYAGYWAFNFLLYRNSDRYFADANGNAWRCVPGYLPALASPAAAQASASLAESAVKVYRHTRKREWGLGVQVGKLDDKRTFVFEDGQTRDIKDSFAHLLEEVELGEDERDRLGNALGANLGQGVRAAQHIDLDKREEAFPALWDARTAALLHLAEDSRCEPVHHMLVKALRANPEFCRGLDFDALRLLFQAPYAVTVRLGFDLIIDRPMTGELAYLLMDCVLAEARAHMQQWLRNYVPGPYEDTRLWAAMITSPHEDNRELVRQGEGLLTASDAFAQEVIARVIATLTGAQDEDEHLRAAGGILLAAFPRQARSLSEAVLRDLLEHDLLVVQEVGAALLLENDRLSTAVPEDMLIALLDSRHAEIRTIGVKLLDKKPDLELAGYPELFVHLALHELADLRSASRATIERLAATHDEFARALAQALSEALSRKLPKGAPADAVLLLKGALREHLPAADKDQTMALLKAKSPHARELGALYLARIEPDELTLFDIVSLANHEMRSIREAAWALCEASVDRFRVTMPAVARLLDSKWQDTREFGLRFVEERFGPEDLGPAVLIAICDSVRPEIQRYGQELIVRNFREADGQEYLAKLSEHPSTRLQLFVTNYLERYAAGDVVRLEALSHYFISVLSRVNCGGVAKRRVLRFLASEALKSREAASLVAGILTRQSVTIAILNKASIIETMVAIAGAYPDIELPLRLIEPEVRHAV